MSTIVLAYSGGLASSVAVHRLAQEAGTEIVTLSLDLGQGDDLNALRARALACGAVRAHVVDAREQFVRECLFPSLGRAPIGDYEPADFDALAHPIVARNLLEIAAIEGAGTVAHAAVDVALDEAIRAIDSGAAVSAPVREWNLDEHGMAAYARDHGLPRDAVRSRRVDQNLWRRAISVAHGEGARIDAAPTAADGDGDGAARLAISFDRGVPVAINGVPMAPVELVESLALIAGRHGVGRFERVVGGRTIVYDAPAAVVLHAARARAGDEQTVVHMTALHGHLTVVDAVTELVNHA